MKRYKIAILGHGFAGDLHREVIEESIPELEVVAITEPKPQAIEKIKGKYVIYANHQDLFSDNIPLDALIVALPTSIHEQAVTEITRQTSIPLLLEKPLGITYLEAKNIQDHIQRKRMRCMVGLTGRFHPEFRTAYNSMKEGDIGDVVSMQERIHFGMPGQFLLNYLSDKNRGVGLENGIHTFDRFQFFSGSKIIGIDGLYKSNRHLGQRGEDYCVGIALTENCLHFPFSQRFTQNQEEDYVFQITGTKGTIKVDGFKRSVFTRGDQKTVLFEHKEPENPATFRERHKPGFREELKHFVKYLNGETEENFLQAAVDAQYAVELQYPEDGLLR